MRAYVSKVPNGVGATAVRVLWKQGRRQVGMRHIGTGRTEAEIALLVAVAWEVINSGQEPLPDLEDARPATAGGRLTVPGVQVTGTISAALWDTLERVWDQLGFTAAVPDEAFKALTLARVIEPTSKADSARVLDEVGAWAPANTTIYRCLQRCQERGYRDRLAAACWDHAGSRARLLIYDVTTLYFETDTADGFRKPGYSKERRLEPQVVVGLLVDQAGFPLAVQAFEGNTGETTTILPVIQEFARAHGVQGFTVVADAGMLSERNLVELDDAGFDFIVGSRITRVPWSITDHTRVSSEPLADQQVFVEPVLMGTKAEGLRRYATVYQYRHKRALRDLRTIGEQVSKAEATITGTRKVKKARFVTTTDTATLALNHDLIASAKARAGIKGYLTSLPVTGCPGRPVPDGIDPVGPLAVIDAYHQLFEVERSFRMSKTDLRARPMFSHERESIEAHLTMVMAALAISRTIQARTGLSIRRFVRTLRPLRAARLSIGSHTLTVPPTIDPDTQAIITAATTKDRVT